MQKVKEMEMMIIMVMGMEKMLKELKIKKPLGNNIRSTKERAMQVKLRKRKENQPMKKIKKD